MTVDCKNDYAVIALSSLDNDKDIAHAESMLLTTVGRVENTGMKMSEAPDKIQPLDGKPPYMQMDDFGTAPILCEVIEATLRLKTNQTNLRCWAVNSEGLYLGTTPITYEDGYAVITLGEKAPSIYYLIQAQ